MDDVKGQLEASIQERIEADADFQASLEGLEETERTQKLDARKSEEFNKELKTLKDGSEGSKKAQELADNYKKRAEKAEALLKDKDGGGKEPKTYSLSPTDAVLIAKADIDAGDIDDVVSFINYQKSLGNDMSVADALKNKTLQAIIADKVEDRRTNAASHIKGGKGAPKKNTDQDILDKANKGETLESDEDMEALFRGRMKARKSKK